MRSFLKKNIKSFEEQLVSDCVTRSPDHRAPGGGLQSAQLSGVPAYSRGVELRDLKGPPAQITLI